MSRRKTILWISIAITGALTAILLLRLHTWRPKFTVIQGAVLRYDADARKQIPISDALVSVSHDTTTVSTRSDASGYFKIIFPEVIWPGQTLDMSFRHADYLPLDTHTRMTLRSTVRRLILAAMKPVSISNNASDGRPLSVVGNIRIRYTVNSTSEDNIGSVVKTFQVVNQGNIPCAHHAPCSPDGNWKATIGSVTLDAGAGNEYRNVRASCIAGPCPFTRINSSGFAQGGRTITASALSWSDTATFLLEAEVFHNSAISNMRESYPVIYDRTLNFTLPAAQEGASIEAEISGVPMIFPLGPDLYLSWATCAARTNEETEKSTVYRCELKPGYRF